MKPIQRNLAKLLAIGLEIQEEIESMNYSIQGGIESGDLFLLTMPIPTSVTWCAVFSHTKDPDLWFCLPGDTFSLLSNCDVAAAEIPYMTSLIFRCQCGLWVHADDIDVSNRISKVSAETVNELRSKVAALASDPFVLFADDEVGHDPDYQEWIDELRAAVDLLRDSLHNEPAVSIRLVDKRSEISAPQVDLQLAASDGDTDLEMPKLIRTLQIFDSPEGKLRACLYDDGVVLEWHPSEEHSFKPLVISSAEQLTWTDQDGSFCTSLIEWVNGASIVSINHETVKIVKD